MYSPEVTRYAPASCDTVATEMSEARPTNSIGDRYAPGSTDKPGPR